MQAEKTYKDLPIKAIESQVIAVPMVLLWQPEIQILNYKSKLQNRKKRNICLLIQSLKQHKRDARSCLMGFPAQTQPAFSFPWVQLLRSQWEERAEQDFCPSSLCCHHDWCPQLSNSTDSLHMHVLEASCQSRQRVLGEKWYFPFA